MKLPMRFVPTEKPRHYGPIPAVSCIDYEQEVGHITGHYGTQWFTADLCLISLEQMEAIVAEMRRLDSKKPQPAGAFPAMPIPA